MDRYRDNELEWLPYDRDYIRDEVPDARGLYSLSCPKGSVIYVGKAEGAGSGVRTRLLTYGTARCHNRWIRVYFSFGKVAWTYGLQPDDLYFSYWLTNNPAYWEAVAIQAGRLTTGGFNQRSEWAPLVFADDACYRANAKHIMSRLGGDALRRFEAAVGRRHD